VPGAGADHRDRYAFVGTGDRAELYFGAVIGPYADVARAVALCDTNRVRLAHYRRLHAERLPGAALPAAYPAADFPALLRDHGSATLVVTTPDWTHAGYITAALDAGWRVVAEKPLTTDTEGCRAIADAAARSDADLVMTFNYRYSPRNTAVRELIATGAVGVVTSVTFEWLLDTGHGADYFRRWHREKRYSGGLFVHKASHHFDLVNWWLDDLPRDVYAVGSRRVYGADGAAAAAPEAFRLDLHSTPRLAAMFGPAATADDGYVRNRGVTEPGVDIEDNLSALVTYEGGALLTYALNAHAPWEGYRVGINGTAGRLELEVVERAAVALAPDAVDPSVERPHRAGPANPIDSTDSEGQGGAARTPGTRLLVQRHWDTARKVAVTEHGGPHGGGDALLLDDVIRGTAPDPLGRRAGLADGLRAVLVGAAANRSLECGRAVALAELGVPRAAYDRAPLTPLDTPSHRPERRV
jgi:predicted dehydrogenase